ncbi:hypothetical protein [Streptomyces sp. NPDC048436]|uniref:hypothetical protein n=1 Tax=Streptomyces sp. NPDC048436 TaxID=3365550 RepID=UPI00371C12F4
MKGKKLDSLESGGPVADDCNFRFQLDGGWIDLTLDDGLPAEALGLAGQAVDRFNPLELTVSARKLVDELTSRAVRLNKSEPLLAASYYTPGGVRLVDVLVDSYGDDDVPIPTPAEVVPILLDWSNVEIAGEADVRYLELASVPAVRVQAMVEGKRKFGFGRQLGEFIKYAFFPPGLNTFVVVSASWDSIQDSEEITQLVDSLAATLVIVPVDSDGNEITGDLPN